MYYMILLKLFNIFEGQIQESITKLLDTPNQSNTDNNVVAISELTTEIITKDDKNQEIYNFLSGYRSVSDFYINKKKTLEWSIIVEKDYINILKYLKIMRILHKDVLLDSEYTDNMYSYYDQLCKKGGLTLVSPAYYHCVD